MERRDSRDVLSDAYAQPVFDDYDRPDRMFEAGLPAILGHGWNQRVTVENYAASNGKMPGRHQISSPHSTA